MRIENEGVSVKEYSRLYARHWRKRTWNPALKEFRLDRKSFFFLGGGGRCRQLPNQELNLGPPQ